MPSRLIGWVNKGFERINFGIGSIFNSRSFLNWMLELIIPLHIDIKVIVSRLLYEIQILYKREHLNETLRYVGKFNHRINWNSNNNSPFPAVYCFVAKAINEFLTLHFIILHEFAFTGPFFNLEYTLKFNLFKIYL